MRSIPSSPPHHSYPPPLSSLPWEVRFHAPAGSIQHTLPSVAPQRPRPPPQQAPPQTTVSYVIDGRRRRRSTVSTHQVGEAKSLLLKDDDFCSRVHPPPISNKKPKSTPSSGYPDSTSPRIPFPPPQSTAMENRTPGKQKDEAS